MNAHAESSARERREMLRCFGEVDPRKNQYIAEDLRKDLPTGSWFLDGDDFREWLNTDCSKLLLTGIRKLLRSSSSIQIQQ